MSSAICMWWSIDSRRATVPSAATARLAIVASIAAGLQSGWLRVKNARMSSARRPSMAGGRAAVAHAERSGKSLAGLNQPPSTRASAATAVGCRAASSTTTFPPQD